MQSITPETSAAGDAALNYPDSGLNYLNKIMSGLNHFGSSGLSYGTTNVTCNEECSLPTR